MRVALRVAAWFSLVLVCMLWGLFTLRREPMDLTLLLAVALCIPAFRRRTALVALLVGAIVLSAFSPVGMTWTVFPGGPRLVRCCPGIPVHYAEAAEAQRLGKCVVCSDVVSGFEPGRYLVW